ncbi:MAG TPA: cytochrome c family protein [Alphaproteobacteria bacterium]|nr:cytochrome c family protein [Alphaproteobacteria bacterium]
MNQFEFNKVLASVLVALIVAMLGSFLSEFLVKEEKLEKSVYEIEGALEEQTTLGAPKALEPIAPLLASANIENGKLLFEKKCTQCHTLQKGAPHKIGPNLWNVIANSMAHAVDFSYSSAMKEKKEKGETWTFEILNRFLHKPSDVVKGTKMTFPGFAKPQERADVIAYLNSQADSPKAFS